MYINGIGLHTYGENETLATDLNEYMCTINEKLEQLLNNMPDMVNTLSSDLENEIEYELKSNLAPQSIDTRAMIVPYESIGENPYAPLYGVVMELLDRDSNDVIAYSCASINRDICVRMVDKMYYDEIETLDDRYSFQEILMSNNNVEQIEKTRATLTAFDVFKNEIIENEVNKWEFEDDPDVDPISTLEQNITNLLNEKSNGNFDIQIRMMDREPLSVLMNTLIRNDNFDEVKSIDTFFISEDIAQKIADKLEEWEYETGETYYYLSDDDYDEKDIEQYEDEYEEEL